MVSKYASPHLLGRNGWYGIFCALCHPNPPEQLKAANLGSAKQSTGIRAELWDTFFLATPDSLAWCIGSRWKNNFSFLISECESLVQEGKKKSGFTLLF